MRLPFLFAAFLLACAHPAYAVNSDWRWIRVQPMDAQNPPAWQIGKGIAKNARFDGRTFVADLYENGLQSGDLAIRLRGTLLNGRIAATALYVGTDANPERFRGFVRKVRSAGTQWETDRIVLSGSWADGYLSLSRFTTNKPGR